MQVHEGHLRNAMLAARVAPEEAVNISKKFEGLDQEAQTL